MKRTLSLVLAVLMVLSTLMMTVGAAKDANGNFGKLLKMTIYLYKSDAADISTYKYVEEK